MGYNMLMIIKRKNTHRWKKIAGVGAQMRVLYAANCVPVTTATGRFSGLIDIRTRQVVKVEVAGQEVAEAVGAHETGTKARSPTYPTV